MENNLKRSKLFVFGDSWANNYFSKTNTLVGDLPFLDNETVKSYVEYHNNFGHWTDHMNFFYDVYSYGVGAATNEQIILQLGNLQNYDYTEGDRVIIIFPSPERFNWIIEKKKCRFSVTGILPELIYRNNEPIINFMKEQHIEKYEWWVDDTIDKDEKKFISWIPTILEKWKPIMVSWSEDLQINNVEFIPPCNYKTIKEESMGVHNDNHPGVEGNFKLFKFFSEKLNLNIEDYEFKPKQFKRMLL